MGLLYVVFKSQPVQTWLVRKATVFLSNELGTKVKVGSVDIEFFKTAVFENVYIGDQHADTLFYFRKLKIDYHTYEKEKRLVILNYLGIEGGKVFFGEHQGDTVGNYEFFIDFFRGGPRDPSKPKVVWTIFVKNAEIDDMRFDYFNRNEPKPEGMDFNYNDMSFGHINAEIEDFYLVDDSLHFQTKHLETIEKCGLRVTHLSADTRIHEGGIEFRDMSLQTPGSSIRNMFIMETKDWKDYSDFNNKVKMKASLVSSVINSDDLGYFSDNLKEYKTLIHVSGEGEGYLVKLRGKNTFVRIYDRTTYKGDWSMTGLPDFENTVLDFDVKEFETDYRDLDILSNHGIPSNFSTLGTIHYSGKFAGFYNDFITFGLIRTRLGNLDADMNIKFKEGLDKAVYSGKLKSSYFRVNDFVAGSQIEDVAFNLDIHGKGLSRNTYDVQLEGNISQLTFRNYSYHGITAKGRMTPGSFTGKAEVRDRNLNLDFDGEFLTAGKLPEARFKARIERANLATLGFDTTEQNVSGVFTMNFTGKTLDDADGSIEGENITISRNGKTVHLPYLSLSALGHNKGRELKLTSDVLEASIRGNFALSKIDLSIRHLLHQLIPAYFAKPARELPNEDFVFDFNMKNPAAFTSLYMPHLYIHPSRGDGYYRSAKQELELNFKNDSIRYNDYVIKKLDLEARKKRDSILKIQIRMGEFTDYKYIKAKDITINTQAFDNIVEYDVRGMDTGYNVSMNADGRFVFARDSISLEFSRASFVIDNDRWTLDNNGTALYTRNMFSLENILFRHQQQSLALKGQFGDKSRNEMDLVVNDFTLKTLNFLTKGSLPPIDGVSRGTITYKVIDKQAYLSSELSVQDFQVGSDTIGNLTLKTNNKANSPQQHLIVTVENGLLDSLHVEGDINYRSKSNNLDLWARFPESEIRVFEPFLKGVASHMKGTMKTKDSLHITGSFEEPVVKGDIVLQNVELLVDYLNATVRFSAVVQSDRNKISMLPFTFYDDKNNVGRAKGYVFHKGFEDYTLNLTLWELRNFHVLNTSKVDNKLFYGQGYVTGSASFSGPFDNMDIRINARTMPGTNIAIPISEGEASALPSYIHFKTTRKRVVKEENDFPIRSLVMDIEATTDANIDIIFDEIMDEKISGTGYGNIRMEMTKSADFYMFGTYTVERGKYLFTAFDFYNKPFSVRKGGTITWHGDPLDAKLNLVAFHSEKADPRPLLTAVNTNTTISDNRVYPITAESELYIKGNLFSPDISFGLNFPRIRDEYPNASVNLMPVITRIKSDKEETTRQIFSLLLMKSFLPPTFAEVESDYAGSGGNPLGNAGSDLVTAQLSNWLNKIDPNWQVNIIYKNGTITLPTEYGLRLSRKFLNDKLNVDGSFSNYSTRPNINVEYQVTKKGNVRIKAYTRSSFNQVNTTSLNTPITTNGVGVVYTTEFNKFLRRKAKPKKQPPAEQKDTGATDTTGTSQIGLPESSVPKEEKSEARNNDTVPGNSKGDMIRKD